jgi:hypothetical protein
VKEEDSPKQTTDISCELQLITETIARTKQTVLDRGPFFLLWGILILLACSATFAFTQLGIESLNWLPWATLMPIGAVISVLLMRKHYWRSKYTSYVGHAYDSVWLAGGTAFLILMSMQYLTNFFPAQAIYPIISFIVGIAVFASGRIMEWVSLRVGGLFWWAGAATMMLLPFQYHPLIVAIAIIPGHIVPGYLLKRQFRWRNDEIED